MRHVLLRTQYPCLPLEMREESKTQEEGEKTREGNQ